MRITGVRFHKINVPVRGADALVRRRQPLLDPHRRPDGDRRGDRGHCRDVRRRRHASPAPLGEGVLPRRGPVRPRAHPEELLVPADVPGQHREVRDPGARDRVLRHHGQGDRSAALPAARRSHAHRDPDDRLHVLPRPGDGGRAASRAPRRSSRRPARSSGEPASAPSRSRAASSTPRASTGDRRDPRGVPRAPPPLRPELPLVGRDLDPLREEVRAARPRVLRGSLLGHRGNEQGRAGAGRPAGDEHVHPRPRRDPADDPARGDRRACCSTRATGAA